MHPHCKCSGAVLCVGTACTIQAGAMGSQRMNPHGSVSASLPGKGESGEGEVLLRSSYVNLIIWILPKGIEKKPRGSVTSSLGKGRRMCAGEALGRGTGMQGQLCASCQPSLSPVHRPLQQALRALLGGESRPQPRAVPLQTT